VRSAQGSGENRSEWLCIFSIPTDRLQANQYCWKLDRHYLIHTWRLPNAAHLHGRGRSRRADWGSVERPAFTCISISTLSRLFGAISAIKDFFFPQCRLPKHICPQKDRVRTGVGCPVERVCGRRAVVWDVTCRNSPKQRRQIR
jgi:hypothetical protein